MLGRLSNTGSLPALELMLAYAQSRQKAIATNIANVDTPGYRAKDVSERDFRQALERAFRGEPSGAEFRPGPLEGATGVKGRANNVDLEQEMAKMVRNSALHATSVALLTHQFSLIREAISGHVIS